MLGDAPDYGSTTSPLAPATNSRRSSFPFPTVTREEARRLFPAGELQDLAKWGEFEESRGNDEMSTWRLINREGSYRQATGAVRVNRLNRSRELYLSDLFHTVVDSSLRTVLLVFTLAYLASILIFAIGYLVVSSECKLGVTTFKSAWLFSLETIMTIGYAFPGDTSYFEQCNSVMFMVTMESILGVICDAIAVGLVYARLARAQTRATTIVFSDYAVIRRIGSRLHLMFQCAEMRKHQLVEAHVRCYAISRHRCSDESSPHFYFRTQTMRLVKPDDELGGMLFMALPNVVVHAIDNFSPLKPHPRTGHHDPSYSYRFPDVIQRDCDVENGNRECKTIPVETMSDEDEERMILQYMESHRMEIVVVLEGTDAVTSDTIQARHSYCASDIKMHHDFLPCTLEAPDGSAVLDFAQFHRVFRVPEEYRKHPPMYVVSNP